MFWQNFLNYCNQIGKTPNAVAAEIGIKSSGTVTGWKNGAVPNPKTVANLAAYFNVPVNALTGMPTAEPLPFAAAGESELLSYYRGFTREGQGRLLDIAESMKRSGLYNPELEPFLKNLDKGFDADIANAYGQ